MKTNSITVARRRFDALLDAVQHEPVLIRRKNCDETVVMPAVDYVRMSGIASLESRPAKLTRKRTSSRKSC